MFIILSKQLFSEYQTILIIHIFIRILLHFIQFHLLNL